VGRVREVGQMSESLPGYVGRALAGRKLCARVGHGTQFASWAIFVKMNSEKLLFSVNKLFKV
jgi:hypothetical protein